MSKAVQPGRGKTSRPACVLTVLLLTLCLLSARCGAQSSASSGVNPPASMSVPGQPATTPTASAQTTAAPPATPSMMPKVPGTELDRIVAIVDDHLILDSDVNEELRLQAFDPYHARAEALSDDRAVERLINRELILEQLKLQPEEPPTDAAVKAEIEQLRHNIPACEQYHCTTKSGWDRFLADHGFTEASFFARWKQRMTVLAFIEERFQMGVNITPEQIQNYYKETLVPEYQRQHAPPPKLAAIHDQVREVLLQQQISNLLSDWLKSLRAQGSVVVLHPGEEAP